MATARKTAAAAPSALAERIAKASAPAWRPEPGETLTAALIGAKMAEGGEYGAYPVATFQKEDGTYVNVHAFHTLLKEGLAEVSPGKGDVVTIHYVGLTEKNESAKKYALDKDESKREFYHNYIVFAGDGSEDDTDEVVDFSALKG